MCSIPCKGYCCRRFYLPFSPEQLKGYAADREHKTHSFNQVEIEKVAEMVIYLGEDRLDANGEPNKSGMLGHWYTCKYLDKRTGGCMNYILRPPMCSEFPYGAPCDYHKCSTHPWWRHYAWSRWVHRKLFGWVTPKEKEQKLLQQAVDAMKKYKWPENTDTSMKSIGTEAQMDAQLVQLKYAKEYACETPSAPSRS